MKVPLIIIGIIVSVGCAFWWNVELAGIFGDGGGEEAFLCLLRVGTGDCQALWLIGLHQTNQIAGLIFYAGILMFALGVFMPEQKRGDDHKRTERPKIPPHL